MKKINKTNDELMDFKNILEKEINKATFKNINVGYLLSDYLEGQLLIDSSSKLNRESFSLKNNLINIFRSFYFFLKIIYKFFISYFKENRHDFTFPKKYNVLTLISNHTHISNINMPLMSYDEEISTIVFYNLKEVNFKSPPNVKLIDYNKFNYFNESEWRNEFWKMAIKWGKIIRKLKKEHNIRLNTNFLLFVLSVQTQKLMTFLSLFKENPPNLVITEYDRNDIASVIVTSANHFQIPTFTFIHGVPLLNNNVYPFLAQNIMCYGKIQYQKFKDIISHTQKLLIVGCHFNSPKLIEESFSTKINVTFALSGVHMKNIDDIIDFCETISKNKNLNGIVKLHPSRNKNIFKKLINDYPLISFVDRSDHEYDKIIQKQDIAVINETSYAFDSLLFGSNVIIYSKNDLAPDSLNEELVINAKIPVAKSIDELTSLLVLITTDSDYLKNMNSYRQDFVNNYYDSIGEESLNKVKDVLNNCL
ncbi:MAG: hypothetical protein HQ480_02505 [Candidatus Pelagibacter sp.]|nr:hypothetical protein [Candidatus Pelagibacter sp.]